MKEPSILELLQALVSDEKEVLILSLLSQKKDIDDIIKLLLEEEHA
ncbi:hypothetical protein [uncultured Methanomethylovorans sp.]|nr:hypothetical protein [uncultured Methanomethylovorans sp.]